MGDGSKFKHGQPAYQSAIIASSTTGIKSRGKGTKFTKEAFGSGFRIAGGDSPSALSDADIPASLSTAGIQTKKATQQVRSCLLALYAIIYHSTNPCNLVHMGKQY